MPFAQRSFAGPETAEDGWLSDKRHGPVRVMTPDHISKEGDLVSLSLYMLPPLDGVLQILELGHEVPGGLATAVDENLHHCVQYIDRAIDLVAKPSGWWVVGGWV